MTKGCGCGGCGGCGGRGTCGGCAGACAGGCCAGVRPVTPRSLFQRPGLPSLTSRIGTHGDFLETMVARLATHPELDRLTVRTGDDPSMALLDCWAIVADTVTFYAERALEEGFLATATQPGALTGLGQLVGYRPRPALGSSGHLVFGMDPGSVGVIPGGTSAKSVPGPDELPQTFETSASVEARAEWNRLAVRLTRPFAIFPDTVDDLEGLTFVGSSLNLRAGDLIVVDFAAAADPRVREIATVAPDFQADRTTVTLVPVPGRPVGVLAELARVRSLAETAAKTALGRFQTEVAAVLTEAAGVIESAAGGAEERVPLSAALSTLHRVVTEARALADEGRVSADDQVWVEQRLVPLDRTVLGAAPAVSAYTRERSPELDYLDRLATAITCPETPEGDRHLRGDADCHAGTPLLATAAALGALRRRPVTPPSGAAAFSPALSTALDPRSDLLRQLVSGGDPALGAALATATATLPVSGPTQTARVVALRVRANPVPDAPQGETQVSVDGLPDTLVPGGWMVSREFSGDDAAGEPPGQLVSRISGVQHFVRTVTVGEGDGATTLRVPTTLVVTEGAILPHSGDVDPDVITLWFGDQQLTLAESALDDPVAGGEIALAQPYPGLQPGRLLVVEGERSDVPGVSGLRASEVVVVGGVEQRVDLSLPGDVPLPVLVLAAPLGYEYRRASVTVSGNVVAATQGETRTEVLGSGRAGEPGQSFVLKQPTLEAPLTHLPGVTVTGEAGTLTVRVDGVRWHPVDLLADSAARDQHFVVEEGPPPSVRVRFGDGQHGSRLPNGIENVTASYRVGAGASGNVGPQRVRQLTSRPLGVTEVTNPGPMTGGTRGDTTADARQVAPLRALALDRLVSVSDYADLAASHPGIAKAAASRLHDGTREVVHLTVAAMDDAPLEPGDLLLTSLEHSLATYGDPHLPVVVAHRERLQLVLSAGLKVDPDHVFDDVAARVRAALGDRLGFARARLGAPVHLSSVVAAIQGTPGVDYVDVDAFGALSDVGDPVRLLSEVTALAGVADVIPVRVAGSGPETYVVGHDPTGDPDTLSTIALRHGLSVAGLVALNPALGSTALVDGTRVVVAPGPRPAQLAYIDPTQPQTLVLRSIP